MTKLALLGAGGKMGVRLSTNLQGSRFSVDHVEVSDAGQRAAEGRGRRGLRRHGHRPRPGRCRADGGAGPADRQDRPSRLSARCVPTRRSSCSMRPPLMPGEMPERADVTYFVTHPCHPPIYNDETDPVAKADFFGGIHAKQHIVCALMQGPEEHYALCEEIAREIYKPVMRAHRCTVENIAVLEPALSETVGITLCLAMKDAVDEVVRRGVPAEAARDFMLGHINIGLSIAFERFRGRQILRWRHLCHRAGEAGDLPGRLAGACFQQGSGVEIRQGNLQRVMLSALIVGCADFLSSCAGLTRASTRRGARTAFWAPLRVGPRVEARGRQEGGCQGRLR